MIRLVPVIVRGFLIKKLAHLAVKEFTQALES